ncbi:hypothetical protein [Paenibacillus pinihumi]|uniref:hypothetical protein n=1 Tax=Paenibacillus pinihumi TaxID=669462 RepID=UPI00049024D4|nr:hypothetical protein [Paenibacillus pinihumi]
MLAVPNHHSFAERSSISLIEASHEPFICIKSGNPAFHVIRIEQPVCTRTYQIAWSKSAVTCPRLPVFSGIFPFNALPEYPNYNLND